MPISITGMLMDAPSKRVWRNGVYCPVACAYRACFNHAARSDKAARQHRHPAVYCPIRPPSFGKRHGLYDDNRHFPHTERCRFLNGKQNSDNEFTASLSYCHACAPGPDFPPFRSVYLRAQRDGAGDVLISALENLQIEGFGKTKSTPEPRDSANSS